MAMAARILTRMATRLMTTDVLMLSQLLSPAFPVGAFAYSHGLERAVTDNTIHDAATLEAWLLDLIDMGGARSDAVLVSVAYQTAPDGLAKLDAEARAFAASAERLRETDLQGAAFCDAARSVWGHEVTGLTYPVAVGHVARLKGLDPELTIALYLQAFVANLCGAAMRLVPLGQVDGQSVQAALLEPCASLARELRSASLDDLFSNAWASDIAAMRHETQHTRIFRT